MQVMYKRPSALQETYFKYCGGCGHAIINKLIAEIIDEKGWLEDTVMVWPIGCSVYADQYFKTDSICALHGRAPALATGLKRARPENLIVVYQGDGDMVSEGMSEIIHAAIRGEKFSVIFVNNAIYGMTGGQMAPTTLEGQITSTTPYGKTVEQAGACLLYTSSNHLFETWLLMHFEDVDEKISKREIYRRLSSHLHDNYSKGHKGKTREIVQNGDIEKAIDNAKNWKISICLLYTSRCV